MYSSNAVKYPLATSALSRNLQTVQPPKAQQIDYQNNAINAGMFSL